MLFQGVSHCVSLKETSKTKLLGWRMQVQKAMTFAEECLRSLQDLCHYDRFVLIGLCWLYGHSEFPPPLYIFVIATSPLHSAAWSTQSGNVFRNYTNCESDRTIMTAIFEQAMWL